MSCVVFSHTQCVCISVSVASHIYTCRHTHTYTCRNTMKPGEEEKEGGFLANLSPEELEVLEERKAKLAAVLLAKREQQTRALAESAKAQKKFEWRKKKMYVKGHKICEANRIYEEAGWYVCEVCTKRFNDIEWIEEHVNTVKHKNNMEWYATRPLPEAEGSAHTEYRDLPDHVEITADEWLVCTLCNAKAASVEILEAHLNGKEHQKRLVNAEWYTTQTTKSTEGAFVLPAYCEYNSEIDLPYTCRWCDKKAACVQLLSSHLEGKDHGKKSTNIGLPMYGEAGHLEAAAAYTKKYGFDVWARQEHWPSWMVDDGNVWKCTKCNKKYITPASVNEHVSDHSGQAPTVRRESAMAREVVKKLDDIVSAESSQKKPSVWASSRDATELYATQQDYNCLLCMLPFKSQKELTHHEQNDRGHEDILQAMKNHSEKPTRPPPRLDLLDI